MGNDPLTGPTLVGIVEVDETLIGGKTKGKGRAYKGNKTWVAGAIQRGGNVRMERIPDVTRSTLHALDLPPRVVPHPMLVPAPAHRPPNRVH